jgi:hypothetical protein
MKKQLWIVRHGQAAHNPRAEAAREAGCSHDEFLELMRQNGMRIERALVIHDPFPDPPELQQLMKQRGVEINGDQDVTASPSYERPP